MIDSFNTTIRNSLKGWYYPTITGILSVVTGAFLFIIPKSLYSTYVQIFGIVFIISGLLRLIFSFQNRKTINGWGWYLIYGMLILDLGIYLTIYAAKSSVLIIGLTALLRSFTLLGTAVDLKRHEHYHWGRIAGWSAAAIILSIVLIAKPASIPLTFVTAFCFITTGIAAILLSTEYKKVNQHHQILRKLMRKLDEER
ncbi:HdeD family acid-resistance protein [Elizabethkingia anophelis]|uniref:HdeD family acid-resistance protein n=1 Tax=Elizabethkingia anophelis TaxID=1117645 RepID=UPI00389263FF